MTLLPASATERERTIEAITCTPLSYDLRQIWNPDTCPIALLPYLAWALSVDAWEDSWSEYQKRETIKRSIYLHRLKGTTGAVQTALAPFGAVVAMTEWYDAVPPEDPYTFSIDVIAGGGINAETTDQIIAAVNASKPVSRHFTLSAGVEASGSAYVGGDIFTNGFQHSLVEAVN